MLQAPFEFAGYVSLRLKNTLRECSCRESSDLVTRSPVGSAFDAARLLTMVRVRSIRPDRMEMAGPTLSGADSDPRADGIRRPRRRFHLEVERVMF